MKVRKSIRVLALLLCLSLMVVPVKVSAYYQRVSVSEVTYYESGDLKNITFNADYLPTGDGGYITVMTNRLRSVVPGNSYGDFTDYGFYRNKYRSFNAVKSVDESEHIFGKLPVGTVAAFRHS